MIKPLLALTSGAALIGAIFGAMPVSAQALKTAKLCNDEYAAQKPALKAAKETKKEFVAACRALPVGTVTPIGSLAAAPTPTSSAPSSAAPGQVKTAGACEAEYKANKGALKDAKEKKKDFIAACRALPLGTATPIGTAAPTRTAAPPTSAPQPQAPALQQASPAPYAPPPAPPSASAPSTRAPTAPSRSGAKQFPAEATAKARCPGATVVWVNTQSKVYHFAGTKNYGNTKAGAYMCETDATTAGDRASATEKHP